MAGKLIELADGRHRLRIAPDLGGGIADAHALTPGGAQPILRPWPGRDAGLFGMGSNVLVPFSNRISGGGFTFGDRFHALDPNLKGERFPIHGDGFQASWEVVAQSDQATTLRHHGAFGPWRYTATLRYALEDGAILSRLQIDNTGETMPFGGGFHPWFPRHDATRLAFAADAMWTETDQHLPRDHVALADLPDRDFTDPRPLPDGFINAAFTGWRGPAQIEQPDSGIAITVGGSTNLDTAVVFSPGKTADFLCFEPVSHAVDAHNQAGMPGLRVLAPGDTMDMSMRIGWSAL